MNKQWWLVIAGLGIAIAVVIGLRYWQTTEPVAVVEKVVVEPEPTPAVTVVTPPVAEDAAPGSTSLPELGESDEFVRALLADWDLPELWKAREDLIRRFVVVLDNAARGELPKRQLAFLAPQGNFAVIDRGNRLIIDPKSYNRYSRYLNLLEALPPETAQVVFTRLRPLFVQALAELGLRDSNPEDLLATAFAQINAIPELSGEIVLVQPKVFYQFANPGLEAMSPLQKQILRMGSENVIRLKAYLRIFQGLDAPK